MLGTVGFCWVLSGTLVHYWVVFGTSVYSAL